MTRDGTKSISYTRVNTYSVCPRKYYLSYIRGLRRQREGATPQKKGELFHLAMKSVLLGIYEYQTMNQTPDYKALFVQAERLLLDTVSQYEPLATFVEAPQSEVEDSEEPIIYLNFGWDDFVHEVMVIVKRTVRRLIGYQIESINGVPLIEYEVHYSYRGYEFVGIVDAVLVDEFGVRKLFDWKLTSRFKDYAVERVNHQLALYQYILEKAYGISVPVGVLYQVKSSPPSIPSMNKPVGNKPAAVSRKKINTDWESYSAFVLANGLDPADYEDEMRPKLQYAEFYRPVEVSRSPQTLQRIWDVFIKRAKIIDKDTEFLGVYAYPCQQCQFKTWCAAELHGNYPEELIGTEYEVSQHILNKTTVLNEVKQEDYRGS